MIRIEYFLKFSTVIELHSFTLCIIQTIVFTFFDLIQVYFINGQIFLYWPCFT